jgi:hypothetical protein
MRLCKISITLFDAILHVKKYGNWRGDTPPYDLGVWANPMGSAECGKEGGKGAS